MSLSPISSGAQAYLRGLHLSQEDETAVEACISDYTFPSSLYGALNWAVYRIINAVKHFFGSSDWDAAETLIQNHVHRMAEQRGLLSVPPLPAFHLRDQLMEIRQSTTRLALENAKALSKLILEAAFYRNQADINFEFQTSLNTIAPLFSIRSSPQPMAPMDLEHNFDMFAETVSRVDHLALDLANRV